MKNLSMCFRRGSSSLIVLGIFGVLVACGGRTSGTHPVVSHNTPAPSGVDNPSSVTTQPPPTLGSPASSQPAVNVLPVGQAGQMMLPIGPIFDQGMSNWCWAYSAFHTLRTYYTNSKATDAATLAWRAALQAIDSPTGFTNYMSKSQGISGMTQLTPGDFISQFQQAGNLPAQNWQTIDSSNATNTVNQVVANLRKMIPSVYCSADHCTMIYGFVSDGTRITKFAIGDSAGDPSSTYLQDVTEGNGRFGGVVTLVQ